MTNRIALITGGAKGIGRAIALKLADEEWSIAICYRNSLSDAEETLSKIKKKGCKALAIQCDVSDYKACETFTKQVVSEFGSVHALINCAGPYHRIPILKETVEGWHEMFNNNLHPVFYLSQLVAPYMIKEKWGRIINFSMANADKIMAQPQLTAHFIAKTGVLTLTKTFAKTLAPHNITVNSISPGFISSGSAPEEELQKMVKNIPAGYIGELSDAVSTTRFLLSEEARYVNGTNIHLSGGWGT